jgi:3',5'-cyclic AMP phosphodiesterase CpdA
MRNRIKITLTILLLLFSEIIFGQISRTKLPSSGYNFLVISDFGRNGYGNQKEVAKVMGPVAAASNVKFIVTAGDNFQISGVQSVSDPLWMTSYENIYDYPVLLQDWYPALGNHDYAGNVQAEIDYSQVSRRWRMPANYYTLIKEGKDCSIRLVILDTQLIVRGIKDSDPQFSLQNAKRQLTWVDSVLSVSKEDWVVVVGHHPVYSAHPTRHNTEELVEHLNPLLKKFKVDFYISGHDHIFQHMKEAENE